MLRKHRKTLSLPVLCCGKTEQFQPAATLVEKTSNKVHKISLKQFSTNKSFLGKSLLHKKTINKDKIILFQTMHPKILFTYQSPKNVQVNGKFLQLKVPEKVQFQPQIYIKTISQEKKVSKQEDQRILVSNRIHHRSNYSELKLQKWEEKTSVYQKQKEDNKSLRTQKMKHYSPRQQENKTVNYQKQENKRRNGQQIQLNNEQSPFVKKQSQNSKSGSIQRKPTEFYSSDNFESTMKKWKKGNNLNTFNDCFQKKQRRLNKKTVELNREVYKRGKLFEKVRRIETKFSDNDDKSSSSHHSEVIEDYKSLLVKLQSNRLQDQQFKQI